MVVALRLMRMGTTHRPVYRISVADSRKAPTAKFIEHIGTYNPHPDKLGNKQFRLNVARAKYWIGMGAQPSSMVARLLSRFHLIPMPPQRIDVPTGSLLHRVLAGEDVRDVVGAQQRDDQERDGKKSAAMAALEAGGTWQGPRRPSNMQRRFREPDEARLAQIKATSPWKLKKFDFEREPTAATIAAWQQARLWHQHQAQHPDSKSSVPVIGRGPAWALPMLEAEARIDARETEQRELAEQLRQADAEFAATEEGKAEAEAEAAKAVRIEQNYLHRLAIRARRRRRLREAKERRAAYDRFKSEYPEVIAKAKAEFAAKGAARKVVRSDDPNAPEEVEEETFWSLVPEAFRKPPPTEQQFAEKELLLRAEARAQDEEDDLYDAKVPDREDGKDLDVRTFDIDPEDEADRLLVLRMQREAANKKPLNSVREEEILAVDRHKRRVIDWERLNPPPSADTPDDSPLRRLYTRRRVFALVMFARYKAREQDSHYVPPRDALKANHALIKEYIQLIKDGRIRSYKPLPAAEDFKRELLKGRRKLTPAEEDAALVELFGENDEDVVAWRAMRRAEAQEEEKLIQSIRKEVNAEAETKDGNEDLEEEGDLGENIDLDDDAEMEEEEDEFDLDEDAEEEEEEEGELAGSAEGALEGLEGSASFAVESGVLPRGRPSEKLEEDVDEDDEEEFDDDEDEFEEDEEDDLDDDEEDVKPKRK